MARQFLFSLLLIFPVVVWGQFGPERVLVGRNAGFKKIIASDFDNDGDNDIIYGSEDGIGWLKNLDGNGNFAHPRPLSNHRKSIRDIAISDFNADGWIDVAAIYEGQEQLDIYLNDKAEKLQLPSTLNDSFAKYRGAIATAKNYNAELFSLEPNKLTYYKKSGSELQIEIIEQDELFRELFHATDFDNDGDLDVIVFANDYYSPENRRVLLYTQNDSIPGKFNTKQVLWNGGVVSIKTGDFNTDGFNDLVLSTSQGLTVLQNNGNNEFTENIVIPKEAVGQNFLGTEVTDLNNDGALDILTIYKHNHHPDSLVWFENTGEFGIFLEAKVISIRPFIGDVIVEKINEDSAKDISYISNKSDRSLDSDILWHSSNDNTGVFNSPSSIIPTYNPVQAPGNLRLIDVDGDGDLDLAGSGTRFLYRDAFIFWYEHLDGKGNFGSRTDIITEDGDYLLWKPADIDNDNDLDIVCLSKYRNPTRYRVVWLENVDGKGDFSQTHVVVRDRALISPADFDQDGDQDLLLGYTDKFAICKNDGTGTFSTPTLISEGLGRIRLTKVVDLDKDNDPDILFTRFGLPGLFLLENKDAGNNFSPPRLLYDWESNTTPLNTSSTIFVADYSGDKYPDIIFKIFEKDSLTVYLEHTGLGISFYEAENIYSEVDVGLGNYAIDIDLDGDLDFLSAASIDGYATIFWHENQDGNGNFFSQRKEILQYASLGDLNTGDLNGDGKMDIFFTLGRPTNQFDEILWMENISEAVAPPLDSSYNDIEILVYPNPSSDEFTLEIKNYDSSEPLLARIFDIQGKEIPFTRRIRNNKVHLQAQNWPKGIYLFQLTEASSGQLLGSGKLLKQ